VRKSLDEELPACRDVVLLFAGQHLPTDVRETMIYTERGIYAMTIQYELILIALELALIIYYIRKK
jgi:hypothetical protein